MAIICLPKFLLTIATLFTALHFTFSQSPQPTPADKISLLRRQELRDFLGLNSGKGNGILPIESKEYKCRILTALYKNAMATYGNRPERDIFTTEMKNMLRNCKRGEFRLVEFFNQTFIFPGTKWCGQGNIAENYHDLGIFNETDACCREHDFCDDVINAGRTKHNLINPYGTTRLHCKCDEELRKCFRNVRSVIANTVGYIFFSLLQTQCFSFTYPANGCEQWRRGSLRQYCVKYKLNTEEPKKWQWFDQEPYF